MHPVAVALLLGALTLQLPACGRETGPGQPAEEPGAWSEPGPPSVVLRSIEILHVELDQPVLARDAEGAPRTFEDAYMVRLDLDVSGVPTAPAFNLYVGERRIPEMGGWQSGVYFYVYDPALLERLAGGELFYQIGTEERRSLDARLEIGDLEEIRTVREGELFPNRGTSGEEPEPAPDPKRPPSAGA